MAHHLNLMVEEEKVCCLCGDVGFADKLFLCSLCGFRFQHLYCSNYYCGSSGTNTTTKDNVCDWCQSDGGRLDSSSLSTRHSVGSDTRFRKCSSASYSSKGGERLIVKQHQRVHDTALLLSNGKNSSSASPSPSRAQAPTPRPSSHRRYKLLKDVMC